MNKEKQIYRVGRYSLEITSANRILFPRDVITKEQLIEHYIRCAKYIVPHTKNRLLTMHRFPGGIDHEGFYQKNAADYFPSWIKTKAIEHEERTVRYVIGNNAATLAYLANQACITFHLWLSKITAIHRPDRIIFDLDPSGNNFHEIRHAALNLKQLLEDELGLISFVMTTGSRGLHVLVPIRQNYDFDMIHTFAHDVAQVLVWRNPKQLTLEIRKNKREGKILVDYMRNSFSATTVAPYSVRAKDGAPIAAPLHWDEVYDKTLHPQKYTMQNIASRLATIGDPWHGIMRKSRSLRKARATLSLIRQKQTR